MSFLFTISIALVLHSINLYFEYFIPTDAVIYGKVLRN